MRLWRDRRLVHLRCPGFEWPENLADRRLAIHRRSAASSSSVQSEYENQKENPRDKQAQGKSHKELHHKPPGEKSGRKQVSETR
jgi:hypothetical protein